MPTYSYACTECDDRFDAVQSFSDDALTTCAKCNGRLRKLFNSVGVVFKGSGFYRTDSREASKSGSTSASSSSSESGSSSSGSSGSAEKNSSGSGDKGSGNNGSGDKSSGSKSSGSSDSKSPAPAAASS
ncbi:MAG: putative regulatory protein FmdB family [Mycobacterium sp.]|nr:putative regulatory protein FmdB family [Mycobacterium sp.]